jgi:ribosomal-protein-alanine N-acetyltransferase
MVLPAATAIRLLEESDADALAAAYVRDRAALRRWDPVRTEAFYTPAGQRERIALSLAAHADGLQWPAVILAREEDGDGDGAEVVGQVTVNNIVRGPLQKAFVGYWVFSQHQGRGHATRALGLALALMAEDLGLHRAEASTQQENVGSHRVLERNGFTRMGFAHRYINIDGAWRDSILWERLLAGRP